MIVLGIVATILMVYYAGYLFRCHYHFVRLNTLEAYHPYESETFPKISPLSQTLPTVSVIVPARNEAAKITQCLEAIFAQEYPREKIEVILVNDHSEDATREIALSIGGGLSNFQVIDLHEKQ